MKLIAQKPCNFGGRNFFIGSEIPAELVAEPKTQERLGVISIIESAEGASGTVPGAFSWEEVKTKIAEAVEESNSKREEAEKKLEETEAKLGEVKAQLAEAQSYTAELQETEPGAYEGVVPIVISTDGDEAMSVMLTPEEIQLVVTIRQQTAENAIKAIAEVKSENALILIHALDERKTVKEAAKKQADTLFSTKEDNNEASTGKSTTDTNTEGADT